MPKTSAFPKALEVLLAIPSFTGLDTAALEAIARIATWKYFDAGQVVFLEGELCAGLYIVQKGWLKAVKISLTGREQILRIVGPGETFNEIGVFVGGTNVVTVEVLEPARVWIIQREKLIQLMDEHLPLAHIVTRNLAKRVMYLISLVEDLSLHTVETRLARLLLEQSTGDVVNRKRWSTQAEMAARLGTVPDVLNRALRSLVEEGLIRLERHQIQILDLQGLEAKAMTSE